MSHDPMAQAQTQFLSQGDDLVTVTSGAIPVLGHQKGSSRLAMIINFLRCGVPSVQIVVTDISAFIIPLADGTTELTLASKYYGDNLNALAMANERFTVTVIGKVGLRITRQVINS